MKKEITEILPRMRIRLKKSAGFSPDKHIHVSPSLPHMSKGKEIMIHRGWSGPYRKKVKCDLKICPLFLKFNTTLLYLSLLLAASGSHILSVPDWDPAITRSSPLLNLTYSTGLVWPDKVCKWHKVSTLKFLHVVTWN